MPPTSWSEASSDLVDAALGPNQPALAKFVPHRISQRLHGRRAGHGVAVQVEERVEFVESQAPVAAENGEARGAELATS